MRSFKIFLQVISHVADPMIISVQDFDEYLVGKLVPYVTCQYNKTKEVQATIDQLIGDLISAVEKTEMQKVISNLNLGLYIKSLAVVVVLFVSIIDGHYRLELYIANLYSDLAINYIPSIKALFSPSLIGRDGIT